MAVGVRLGVAESRGRAFFWGQFSAPIEPVAGVIGAALVLASAAFLPYGMAAAAGAMLDVLVEELIPEAARSGTIDVATIGFTVGSPLSWPRQRGRMTAATRVSACCCCRTDVVL